MLRRFFPRVRLTLFSVLLITTVVALLLVLVLHGQKVRALETRVAELRAESGVVAVEGDDRLRVMRLKGGYPGRLYRWRAAVPAEGWAYATLTTKRREAGVWQDPSGSAIGLKPGESSFECVFLPTRDSATWCYTLRRSGEGAGAESSWCGPTKPPWLDSQNTKPSLASSTDLISGSGRGEPVELLHYKSPGEAEDGIEIRVTIELQ